LAPGTGGLVTDVEVAVRSAVGAVVVGGLLILGGCGDDTADSGDDGDDGGTANGTLAVRLEPTEGVFVEGFDVGLRISTPDGDELDRVLWSEFVAGLDDPSVNAYYDSVLEEELPAGIVVVEAAVSIGIGPGPVPPDLDAPELPCRLEVEVPGGGRVDVEVSFQPEGDCLRKV
jgi:hypothetical protein